MERLLVICRHGESEWNGLGLFTGLANPSLTEKGEKEAQRVGRVFKGLNLAFDEAQTSLLSRAQRTAELILQELGASGLPTVFTPELNERDYGDLSGLSKAEAVVRWGKEQVWRWRRSYDVAPPNGESLKDTVKRVSSYLESVLLPKIIRGEKILVVAHGNLLRAIIMRLENLSPEEIITREVATGCAILYRFGDTGEVIQALDLKDQIMATSLEG